MEPVKKKRVIRTKANANTVPTDTLVTTKLNTATDTPKAEEKPTCCICVEPYNKVANTEVKCCFCEKSSCRRCIQTFITSSTNDPHCMHCNKIWDREFIDDNLTMTYRMNDYKKHRETILLEREIALMPATQYRAEQIRQAEKLEKELLPPFDGQLKILYEEQSKINKEINRVYALRSDALYQIRLLRTGNGEKPKTEAVFTRKCPDGDCRGFLSTAWKCGLCSKWACADCHEVKGENKDSPHECKPENVATAKLLAKDSRNCPGCATVITKIEGCDQMWCPQCHTAFSWRTGHRETGVVHNPHFYEWQRKQNGGVAPRVPGDIACGGIPHYNEVRTAVAGLRPKEIDYVLTFHRVMNHVQHVDLPRYHNVFNEADNQELRVQYLLGNVSKEILKTTIQVKEKRREKERAVRRALEVLVQGGTDIIRRIMAEAIIEKKRKIIEELDGLRIYVNDLLAKVHERMKLSVHQYKSDWATHYPFSQTTKRAEKLAEEAKKAKEAREAQRVAAAAAAAAVAAATAAAAANAALT